MSKTKPVLEADGQTRAESREVTFKSGEVADQPGWYIPGYSEQVRANDIAKGERFASKNKMHGLTENEKQKYYERFKCDPKPLPYVFNYLRVALGNGEERNQTIRSDLAVYKRRGWVPAKESDFEEGGKFYDLGWRLPPDVEVAGDGTLRRWDTALFYIDGDKYRRMQAEKADSNTHDPLGQIPESHRVRESEEGGSYVQVPDGSL